MVAASEATDEQTQSHSILSAAKFLCVESSSKAAHLWQCAHFKTMCTATDIKHACSKSAVLMHDLHSRILTRDRLCMRDHFECQRIVYALLVREESWHVAEDSYTGVTEPGTTHTRDSLHTCNASHFQILASSHACPYTVLLWLEPAHVSWFPAQRAQHRLTQNLFESHPRQASTHCHLFVPVIALQTAQETGTDFLCLRNPMQIPDVPG